MNLHQQIDSKQRLLPVGHLSFRLFHYISIVVTALVLQFSFLQEAFAVDATTTTTDMTATGTTTDTSTTATISQIPIIDMFNSGEGLNIVIDGVGFESIAKLSFDDVDVTMSVQELISSGIIQVSDGVNSLRLLVLLSEPFLGDHKLSVENYNGLSFSKKFILEQPDTSKATAAVWQYTPPTSTTGSSKGVYQYVPPERKASITITGCAYERKGGGTSASLFSTNGQCIEPTVKGGDTIKLAANAPLRVTICPKDSKYNGTNCKDYATTTNSKGVINYTTPSPIVCTYGYTLKVCSTEDNNACRNDGWNGCPSSPNRLSGSLVIDSNKRK